MKSCKTVTSLFPLQPSLHLFLFSTSLWELANSSPVHSLMLSSHLFFSLPHSSHSHMVCCKMVFTRPDTCETWAYHFSLRFLTCQVFVWSDGLLDFVTVVLRSMFHKGTERWTTQGSTSALFWNWDWCYCHSHRTLAALCFDIWYLLTIA